ncbi:MAG: tetratricopeptide repeat protein, partial [Planctomycetota bacterium]
MIFLLVITLFGGGGQGGTGRIAPAAKVAHERATQALQAGKLSVAVDEARRAVELQPDFAGFYKTLGDAYENAKDLPEAANAYGRALALERKGASPRETLDLHRRYASLLHQGNRSQEAIREWTAILEVAPDDTEALHGRGLAYKALDRATEAIADFTMEEKARRARADGFLSTLPRDPTEPITPEQVELAGRAEAVDPRNAKAILHLAYADLRAKRAKEAMGRFEALVRDDPVEAHLGRARALQSQGKEEVERAIEAVDKALLLKDDHVGALLLRSGLRSSLGRTEGALEDAEKAARLDPRSAVARLQRGAARFESGNRKGAREDFEAASLDAGPSGRRALLASAVCALSMDEASGARAILD